jgi:hypothetical protein
VPQNITLIHLVLRTLGQNIKKEMDLSTSKLKKIYHNNYNYCGLSGTRSYKRFGYSKGKNTGGG